jgi:uncharacterized protein YecE (DUF72 family)
MIRTGTGGWIYPPWRGVFYPPGLRQADELFHASRRHGAIEINATHQSLQTPQTFARWASQTPEGFVFTVKAFRGCTQRRRLAESGEAIGRFLGQGLSVLGDRLGPILWSFMANKAFDAEDFAAFLDLLPGRLEGRRLRHCVEARHPSFVDPRFTALCRDRGVAICLVDDASIPMIDETTADFSYARLMRGRDEIETGYAPPDLDLWARRLALLGEGRRDVFAFFIREGKLRAPAAALALADRLSS